MYVISNHAYKFSDKDANNNNNYLIETQLCL